VAQRSSAAAGPPSSKGPKRHAADEVFDQLAAAILHGSLPPGDPLPPERQLSERFGVSRLIVRQAVHRLAELGLVRVRQGGATIVVHPAEAADVRVIEIIYRLGPRTARELRELVERQLFHGYALVHLASRCGSAERLAQIAAMASDYVARGAPTEEMLEFEKRFFGALAEATDNRIFRFETMWWFRMVGERPDQHHAPFMTAQTRAMYYKELSRRLAEDDKPARFYLDTIEPILDSLGQLALGPIAPR
jgi:DNA-binding FadR family transcriptional regulator